MGKAGPKKGKCGATEPKPKTAHQEFIGQCLRNKEFHGDLNHKERFSLAVKAWNHVKPVEPTSSIAPMRLGCSRCRMGPSGCISCNPLKAKAHKQKR